MRLNDPYILSKLTMGDVPEVNMVLPKRFFILTGEPGVGKTTVTKRVYQALREKGVKTVGFYTEEVRRNGFREGFDVVSLSGERGRLARDARFLVGVVTRHRLGKYAVLVREFEKVGLKAISETPSDPYSITVIDEVGKMEFFSDKFRARIKEVFHPAARGIVLATIPVGKSDGFIEALRTHPLSQVFLVTRKNRHTIHNEVLGQIANVLIYQDIP